MIRIIFPEASSLAPLALMLVALLPTAQAQNFEAFYGEVGWRDRAEDVRAVRWCPGGGSIAVGTRTHPTLGAEALATRVDDFGVTLWQRSYRIGGATSSSANAVIEISDSTRGFAIAGSTSPSATHMFAMRVDCEGEPRWTRRFANQSTNSRSVAWDLVEVPPATSTSRPELLIVGDEQLAGGSTQGRIARLDLSGAPVFDLAYIDPTSPPGMRLRAATLAPNAAGALQDVVIGGSAARYSNWNFDRRGLMLRIRSDGTPVCNAVLGPFDSGSEDFQGATTLQTPPVLRGQTVLVGATVPGAGIAGQRAYLARFREGNCAPLAQSFWPFPAERAHAVDVHEYAGTLGGGGRIAVAGTVTAGTTSEGYVGWASSFSLMPFLALQRFGLDGGGAETLRALDPLANRLVLAGATGNDWDAAGDPQDLFLVQPTPFLQTSCSLPYTILALSVDLPHERFEPRVNRLVDPVAVDTRANKTADEGYCCALSPL
jgi:hypothetical protein